MGSDLQLNLDGKADLTYSQAVVIFIKLAIPSVLGLIVRRMVDVS